MKCGQPLPIAFRCTAQSCCSARDEGNDWQTVTMAVAAGLADRAGSPLVAPSSTRPEPMRPGLLIVTGALAYVVLRPVLGLGHELVVAALAEFVHVVVGTGVWEPLIRLSGLDPIYAGAAVRAAGGVQVAGFA